MQRTGLLRILAARNVVPGLLAMLPALFCLGVIPLASQEKPESSAESERRALDPLAESERAAAERIARRDSKIRQLLGEGQIRVVSVEPFLAKAESLEKTDPTLRQVEVVLFQPQKEVGARVLVDLRRSSVVEVQRLSSQQVAMTADDLAAAYQLAARDPTVQKALGSDAESFHVQGATSESTAGPDNSVTGLPMRSADSKDPCAKHRCMELFFRRGTDYLSEPTVLVDLTARHVYVERRKAK